MGVVPAGMHHIDFLAQVLSLGLGSEGQTLGLLHGQGVHVGAQGHGRAGLRPLQDCDHAGPGDAGPHLKPEAPQVIGDKL